MHRPTLTILAAALFAVAAGACGGDDGATTYATMREGDAPDTRETRPRDTRPPRSDPSTPGTIVLPTFPSTSSTEVPPSSIPAADDITVQDTWFVDDGVGGVTWGVTFESSAATAYENVPVQVDFFDDAGTQIGVAESTIPLVVPGVAATTDFVYDLDGTPASIEVTIAAGDASGFEAAGELTVGGGATDPVLGFTAQITSTSATDLEDVTAVGVWRDADGKIAGMAIDYVRLVQANGVTWFSLVVPSTATGEPADVYVTPRPEPYEATPPDPALAVKESWFYPDGTGGYDWGALVANSGTGTWSGPYVLAKFFDADNRLIDSDDGYFGDVRPGDSAVVGFLWSTPVAPARIEVVFIDGGFAHEPDDGELTVADIAVTADDATTATVTGTVTSSFAEVQSFVQVTLIWRDASNVVVFSASTYLDEIPAGGAAALELTLYGENVPTTPPTETYWSV